MKTGNNSLKNEKDIIVAIANGDREAFRSLYDSFSGKVYNTALSYLKNIEEAEEVTQDVFSKIFRYAANFKGDASLNTWIYRITVNTSLTYLNKRKRFSFLPLKQNSSLHTNFEHPGVLLENKEDAKLLYEVIDSLPDSQKTAFILSYIEGLPRQEVADIMENSLKAVESLLMRAKKNMRTKLEKSYPNRRKRKKG